MKECQLCLINNSIPGITFRNNICNICHNYQNKIDRYNFSKVKEKKKFNVFKKKDFNQ